MKVPFTQIFTKSLVAQIPVGYGSGIKGNTEDIMLAGITVAVISASVGTATDTNGSFEIKPAEGTYDLQISRKCRIRGFRHQVIYQRLR